MLPQFGIEGGLPLAISRAVVVAALLSAPGCLAFRVFVEGRIRGGVPAEVAWRLRRCGQLSLAAAAAGLVAWLVAQAVAMADAASLGQAMAAVPDVLEGTAFGWLLAAQAVAVLLAGVAARRDWRRIALALAVAALALQAGHGHAASMYGGPSLLLAVDVAHLLSASAWLGGLLPLLIVVQGAPAKTGAQAARWFSPLGKLCVAGLAASALIQGWVLVGSVAGLVGTAYGWVVLAKGALLAVLLGFALANRYRLAPALLRGDPAAARRSLVLSIAVQTGFGLAAVAAAVLLSSLPPAMHEQPLWPFPERFTLDVLGEDPAFRNEVLEAVLALAGAAALLAAAILARGWKRGLAAAAAVPIVWFAVPHLSLLFVPAYPTSFYHSPTGFSSESIVAGAALFPEHCAVCHGPEGRGDGPAAKGLPVPPADLTAQHLWMHSDGELFWWLTHGIEAPEGGPAMPAFGSVLTPEQRWALIDDIRAHNAGLVMRQTGQWDPPVQAPGLQAECTGGRVVTLADLRGGFVRLHFGPASPAPGVTTVAVSSDPALHPSAGLCVARDEVVAAAYAVVSGRSAGDMAGIDVLIDAAGWLRAMQSAPGWSGPALLAEIKELAAHPVAASAGGMDGMRM